MFNLNSKGCKLDFSKKSALLIRILRNTFGMSQSDLSECAKIARPTISRLEKLETDGVKVDTLEKALAFFQAQGVEFGFDNNGVTIHLPMHVLAKACILIQENTHARGGVNDVPSIGQSNAVAKASFPYARKENESIAAYIQRLDQELSQ